MRDRVHFTWGDPDLIKSFRTGVCLHGHTMYSEECLWFLPRYLRPIPAVSQILGHYQRGPRPAVDFSRAYWTPPLSPMSALRLEQKQISNLGLRPFVSLTDHDNVEAGMGIQVAADALETPVSVEWTVPYWRSILHLGIHNLPPLAARSWMRILADYTSAPDEQRLPQILSELAKIPDVLIVLNHPFWLEEGVEESDHRIALDYVLRECIEWLHAFELNGTRRWKENAAVIELARAHSRPVISGGDRHACEPAACLNLTNARSFSEFVAEVRSGQSWVLFMPHYQEPMALRLLEASWDVLRPYPEYPGRERWIDRFFYRGDDGAATPLAILWKDRAPWPLNAVTGVLPLFTTTTVRQTLRFLLSRRTEPQF
jgi:hypothetical protein